MAVEQDGLPSAGLTIAPELLEQVVAQARAEMPDECCGVIASADGVVTRVFEAENMHHTPLRFEIDGPELFRIYNAIEDAGWDLSVIYHSHTRSAPRPSQTDINMARGWPSQIWLIVGLAGEEPEVRAFRIVDDHVTEVSLTVA